MASGTWNSGFWGQNQWNDLANPTFTLTGISLSGVIGTTTEAAGEINTGWGRIEWGINAWGEFGTALPTGVSASFNIGTVAVTAGATATNSTNNGQTITGALGAPAIDIQGKVFPTGFGLSGTLGAADAGPDAMLTTNHATMGLGSVQAYNQTGWSRQEWSENGWGVEGQYANVDVTGIAMSAGLGSVVAVPAQEVDVTGLPALARVASVTPIIHVDVQLTGNALTMAQGSGSALIWNEVNTGTAPIDPPGWQEVAA